MAVNNVKGTRDIIGEEANAFNYIENLLKQICELFSYNEVRPPVMEYTNSSLEVLANLVTLSEKKCIHSLIKRNVPSH